MFASTRNRLTLQYTVFTGVALIIFAVLFYFGLSSLLLREQEQDVLTLAVEQGTLSHEQFEENKEGKKWDHDRKNEEKHLLGESYFYYAISSDKRNVSSQENFPELRSELLPLLTTWHTRRTEVISVFLDNGQSMGFMVAGVPVYDDGKQIGMVFVGKDLRAHYHVLTRLMQALTLSSLIFLLIATLAGYWTAKKALIPIKSAFAAQRQFVADASHELRTPLSVFQASLEFLEKKEGSKLNDSSRQVLLDLKDEVGRMTRLVSDLLTLARADSRAVEIVKEDMDLRLIGEQVVRALSPLASKKNITVQLSDPQPVLVCADKDRMAQLLFILLDNAIKFTPDGGQVTVSLYRSHEHGKPRGTIVVQDTGIGMTLEEQAHIFERFYRADKARSGDCSGFGLGLAIATWIVGVHEGTIGVTAELGRGSTITIHIPR